jgi:hypothetical protein
MPLRTTVGRAARRSDRGGQSQDTYVTRSGAATQGNLIRVPEHGRTPCSPPLQSRGPDAQPEPREPYCVECGRALEKSKRFHDATERVRRGIRQ